MMEEKCFACFAVALNVDSHLLYLHLVFLNNCIAVVVQYGLKHHVSPAPSVCVKAECVRRLCMDLVIQQRQLFRP